MENLPINIENGQVKVTLLGDIGVDEATLIREEVIPYTEDGFKHFVFDCSGLSFIDSSGLGVLVAIQKRVQESNGKVVIKGMNKNVKELFELTRLISVFTIED